MKCPKEIRICPELWVDCDLCSYNSLTKTCLYPKSDLEIVIQAAKIVEEVMHAVTVESAMKIKGLQADTDFWTWWGRTSPPGLHSTIPLPLDGPSEPGGGSKSKVPPKPPYKMPEYLKNWGRED